MHAYVMEAMAYTTNVSNERMHNMYIDIYVLYTHQETDKMIVQSLRDKNMQRETDIVDSFGLTLSENMNIHKQIRVCRAREAFCDLYWH